MKIVSEWTGGWPFPWLSRRYPNRELVILSWLRSSSCEYLRKERSPWNILCDWSAISNGSALSSIPQTKPGIYSAWFETTFAATLAHQVRVAQLQDVLNLMSMFRRSEPLRLGRFYLRNCRKVQPALESFLLHWHFRWWHPGWNTNDFLKNHSSALASVVHLIYS